MKHISRTKRRMKKYTKTAKRIARMKRRTRRIRRSSISRRKIRRSRIRRRNIRGGDGTVVKLPNGGVAYGASGTVAVVPAMGNKVNQTGGDNAAIIAGNAQAAGDQNAGNNLLKGGSYNKKINKQRGGDGCTGNVLSLYAYNPPDGMMGPIAQPSTDAASNNLILQAANISVNSQANAQFDSNVNKVV